MNERDALSSALAGRYSIGALVGEGGMGRVYLGTDLRHNRPVAIKTIRFELASESSSARFQREISSIAALRHPHILPLIDSGVVDGLRYLITPFIEGETLAERMARPGQMPLQEVVAIARDLGEGLACAHRSGIIHRDVKPENVLLSEGHALIADFGLAREIQAPGSGRVSTAGSVIGTPLYMSPEQATGEINLDGRTDIYSLACLVYEMLAAAPPFDGPNAAAIIAHHVIDPPPDIGLVRSDVPGHLSRALAKALAKAPADRYGDAIDFVRALEGSEPSESPAHRLARSLLRRKKLTVGAAAVAAVTALVAALWPTANGWGSGDEVSSFIVVGFQAPEMTGAALESLRSTETELTRLLSGWKEVEAVPTSSAAELRGELGISDGDAVTLREALEIARQARVEQLITLSQTIGGDSLHLVAQRFDVRSGEAVGAPVSTAAVTSELFALVAPAALAALDLGDTNVFTYQRETSSLHAIRLAMAGKTDLEQLRLESAEKLLRESVATDSTFGRAQYLLSVTLFWRGSRNPGELGKLGGEIRRYATAARRLAEPMPDHDRGQVDAFFQFTSGEYQEAREGYLALIASDSTDVYAWLFLGTVEHWDPWAVETANGDLRPRANLNRATAAFLNAVRIAPDFYLGFGYLFQIYTRVADAARVRTCKKYLAPHAGAILPWETAPAGDGVIYCPLVRDTVEWIPREAFLSMPRPVALAGAGRFLDASSVQLRRWAEYAPDSPWPERALADWELARAELNLDLGSTAPWATLVGGGLAHAERALRLASDTIPGDLVRVGNLRLAMGDMRGAVSAAHSAIELSERRPGSTVPMESANPLVAGGEIRKALDVVAARTFPVMRVPDSDGNSIDVLVVPLINRLIVYGSAAWTGPQVRETFEQIESTWSQAGYTEDQRSRIRGLLLRRIRPALALVPEARRLWLDGTDLSEPALRGLDLSDADSVAARAQLNLAARAMDADTARRDDAYLTGLLAQELNNHHLAIRAFDRLEAIRARPNAMDAGWGLETQALLLRARSYEALSDKPSALQYYQRFRDCWAGADVDGRERLKEANDAITRLRGR